jgi:hypothetical protein
MGMREITYISPTQLSLFEENPSEYYLKYLATDRPERIPQTRPMSVGSAFDAQVKAYLYNALCPRGAEASKYELKSLFEAQVEPQNRDWAWTAGEYVFQWYKTSGALADIMLELRSAVNEPRFEFEVRATISVPDPLVQEPNSQGSRVTLSLLGKPDCHFLTTGYWFVLDWKVNGYCSQYSVSPLPGYVGIRGVNRGGAGPHRDAHVSILDGIRVNTNQTLDIVNKQWADQLTIYDWLTKASEISGPKDQGPKVQGPLGQASVPFESLSASPTIYAIDQIVCKPGAISPSDPDGLPSLRVAQHRMLTNSSYGTALVGRLVRMKKCLASQDTFFDDMTPEQSADRCGLLEQQALALKGDGSEADAFMSLTRGA